MSVSNKRILVVGDVMVDKYVFGDVHRLSQEAPVPVVRFSREECRLGAAANVAANCASLGTEVTLIGIVGQDECGDMVFDMIHKAGINAFLLADGGIKTTQKLRVIGRNQQIVRVDFESRPSHSIREKAAEQIAQHDIMVFSDYGKGALTDVADLITVARKLNKTVLVDPKGYDYSKYRWADMVKPNIDEMREMVGGWATEAELLAKANTLRREGDIGSILLTRAAEGMTLYFLGETHIQAKAVEVFDVTGAGDTVMASIAVELAKGKTLVEAATVANYAAAIAVSRFGTYAVKLEELKEAMCNSPNSSKKPAVPSSVAMAVLQQMQSISLTT